ncbi:RNA polymerase sigma factor [Mucilaginibacter sp. L3T2-6]|uniref:RNA polymerase sigma factor n=1 Tax=Mucilaginibacter sp. L3T2-6 TaxID=3062491 RepID=UPI002676AB94|nr:sigma-70 family RNA polymerase sigma factor [Mucilaginibacter sp. L3T2-6]MDO3641498.1 sigma-70 family RNA polymerase sigma factor [Mucilaginibacter sp. L3T2-6]MDV6213741.1 sigma-70 family RNA polymerase sigma factor [Mucilaginibacter sp. L3T2-6]
MKQYTEILDLLKSQQQNGLEQLYENYGKKFYSYCIRQWSLAEDDAWEIIYKTLETLVLKLSNYDFESQAHFNNFLYKVLINFIRQHFRARRNQEDHELMLLDFQDDEDSAAIVTKLLNEQAFKDYYALEIVDNPAILALKEALNKMDEQEKDILLLRAQNYSYEEIAKLLAIENNQLKVKHHRAKKKLVQTLIDNQSH